MESPNIHHLHEVVKFTRQPRVITMTSGQGFSPGIETLFTDLPAAPVEIFPGLPYRRTIVSPRTVPIQNTFEIWDNRSPVAILINPDTGILTLSVGDLLQEEITFKIGFSGAMSLRRMWVGQGIHQVYQEECMGRIPS